MNSRTGHARNDHLLDIAVYILLISGLLAILFPLVYILSTSFAPEKEYLTRGFFLFPKRWSLEGYRYLLGNPGFLSALSYAVEITVIGTAINMLLTTLMAYGLSKKQLKGRSVLNGLVLFTLLFSGGTIPTYLVVKGLGLVNSYWALWLTTAIAPFHLIVMRGFFQAVPAELEEAARMDGSGEWRLLWSVIVPLSLPAIATFTLFYAVQQWNTYFAAILYINDSSRWPLQVFLRQMLIEDNTNVGRSLSETVHYTPAAKMAAIVLTVLPLLVCFPFLQKYFNKGVLLGSIKG
ncbi:carbohydrate ABC transporter permease [Paenibacillus sp. S28]|uniref:carbohydrate ABC transporter permease n=1 Tax=Paenibacillus sp. S28 TaxID=2767463 RepID=UPI00190CF5D4|nr:carbohydrate ABC transporter permease [Paenibacillus sp. S28]MBJ9992332.1 carbohydrate ABC transporter permease [Paenibacillus sp. S28]